MTLDRYYARRFLQWFLLISVVLMTLVLLIDLSEQVRRYGDLELGLSSLLGLTLLNAPSAMNTFLPLIMTLTTVVLFVGFARSSELVVTRAIGRSGIRALLPTAFVALVIGALAVVILNPIAAATSNRYTELSESYRQTGNGAAVSLSGKGLWLRQGNAAGQSVIHAQAYRGDAEALVLYRVTILTYSATGGPIRRIVADEAYLDGDEWVLTQAKMWPLQEGVNPERSASTHGVLRLSTSLTNDRIRETLGASEGISIYDLPETIADLEAAGFSTTQFQVRLQSELARPLFLMAMALVGAAFTMRHTRLGGTGIAVISSILVGFGLYFINNFARILGENGEISVYLAAWAPPVASILLTMGMLLHAEDG